MLQVRDDHYDRTTVLTLKGPFCRSTTTGLHTRILGAQEKGSRHIILNFSGVTAIDSTGLGELFIWSHNLRAHQVQISIVKSPTYSRNHIDWGLLSEIIPIYGSEDEAKEQAEFTSG